MSVPSPGQFPWIRMRRNRRTKALRNLVQETTLSSADFIYPVFVLEGEGVRKMSRRCPAFHARASTCCSRSWRKSVISASRPWPCFPVIDQDKKSLDGAECANPDGLVQRTVRAIKEALPELAVMTDVALDPYTTHGQDGIIDDDGYVLNDVTVDMLVRQAVSHADAGADIVAPSDMMDGRIGAVRVALEDSGHINTVILAYSAKFSSSFYGPFRDACGSAENIKGGDKHTYQVSPANSDESVREVGLDLDEGADMVMVKPAMPYLDIVRRVKDAYEVPTFAYQVSGEYAMLKAAAQNGWLDEKAVVLESLLGIKRAGANAILTYYAIDAARWLAESE